MLLEKERPDFLKEISGTDITDYMDRKGERFKVEGVKSRSKVVTFEAELHRLNT